MPGITVMRPQGKVNVIRLPPGVHPGHAPPVDGRDMVLLNHEDRKTFRVEKVLGEGAFGVAFRVRVVRSDEKFKSGEVIVVKQVRSRRRVDKEKIQEEYAIARKLGKHENIVETYALMPNCLDGEGQDCDRLFLKYCNAGTLAKIMDIHKSANLHLPENFLWYTFASLGYALARMHNGLRREDLTRSPDWTGYVHYDLKPDNIFLNWSSTRTNNPYPTPKLADFGCSGRIGRNPKWLGHSAYLSPEVVRDPWQPCMPECDIWALGMSMYQLLEFEMPFAKLNGDPYQMNFKRYRPMRSGYSSRLKMLVERCLDFDYRKRPDAEKIFQECKQYKSDLQRKGGRRPWGHHRLLMEKPI